MRLLTLTTLALLVAASVHGAGNDVISINFNIVGNDANTVDADETAVVGADAMDTAITNAVNVSGQYWNNILLRNSGAGTPEIFTNATQNGNTIALVDSTGTNVATLSSAGTFHSNFSDATTGDRTAHGETGLIQSFLNLNKNESVSISGLSSWAPNGYRVVAFFEIGTVNRTTAVQASDGTTTQSIWTKSTTTLDGDADEDGLVDWKQATGTGSATATTNGNYGVFETVFAGDTLTLTGSHGSPRSVLNGLQIIALGTDYPAVTPTPVTEGLELWLDATDVDGDGRREGLQEHGLLNQFGAPTYLQHWTDKSGNSNAVYEASRAPVFMADAGSGGMDISRWEQNDRMHVDTMNIGTNVTVLAVFRANTNTADQQIFNSNGKDAGGANYILEIVTDNIAGRVFDGSGKANIGDPYRIDGVNPQLAVYCVNQTPSPLSHLLTDGVLRGSSTTSTTNPAVTATASIGAHPSNDSNYFDGDIYELLIYDRKLTEAELYQVSSYLNDKYELGINYSSALTSVSFYRSTANLDLTYLYPTNAAGLLPAENWLNIDVATSRSFPPTMLQNTNGVALPVVIESTVTPGYNSQNSVTISGPNHKMMNSALYYDNQDGTATGAISISGLATNGMPERYKLILYFETNANNREHEITIGDVTRYALDGATFDGTFIEASGAGVNANYMVFDKMTESSFSIDTRSNGRCGIAGIQIISLEVPPPATIFAVQ